MKNLKLTEVTAVGEVIVGYKRNEKFKLSDQPKVTDSRVAADYLRSVFVPEVVEHHEEMMLLLLNRQNRIMGWAKLSSGGVAGTVCDAKVIFQVALNANASGIVLCHNHPSGNTTPSEEDKRITTQIGVGAKYLEIKLIDHIILTADNYLSFADEGFINH